MKHRKRPMSSSENASMIPCMHMRQLFSIEESIFVRDKKKREVLEKYGL
jgi:hypothetical protein